MAARPNIRQDDDGGPATTEDRISLLPEAIQHNILCRLRTREAGRTMILSKAWKRVYDTLPLTEFDEDTFNADHRTSQWFIQGMEQEGRNKFHAFVDDSLRQLLGLGMTGVQALRFSMRDFDRSDLSFVDHWMQVAALLDIKELHLDLGWMGYDFPFAKTVRGMKSLEVLDLAWCGIELPFDDGNSTLGCLKELCLSNSDINEDTLLQLSRVCPLLETLVLKSCENLKRIEVEGLTKLRRIELEDCAVTELETGAATSLRISRSATSLRYSRSGQKPCNVSGDSLEILEVSNLLPHVPLPPPVIINAPNLQTFKCADHIHRILSSLPDSLTLREQIVKIEIVTPHSGNLIPISLALGHYCKLSRIEEVIIRIELDEIKTVPEYFGRKFPFPERNLKHLVLDIVRSRSKQLDPFQASRRIEALTDEIMTYFHPKTVSVKSDVLFAEVFYEMLMKDASLFPGWRDDLKEFTTEKAVIRGSQSTPAPSQKFNLTWF
ncbi:hypothetical protein Tsubulata_019063 [Turnera subulata]|uniref:F-box domain-containing protein n=1 Tax=Turnera subulata TaxID=218843 RepID=A0A9Q0G827_9ROSI|nr:hypothetical protein Tsubulata_019063 [Turnera subulata]